MKKSELKRMIREQFKQVLKEEKHIFDRKDSLSESLDVDNIVDTLWELVEEMLVEKGIDMGRFEMEYDDGVIDKSSYKELDKLYDDWMKYMRKYLNRAVNITDDFDLEDKG